MLNQLTQSNKLSQLILTAGLCLATVLAIQLDRPATTATEKNLNENGLILNGTSFNGANLNGTGLSANGVHFKRFGLTSPTSVTAAKIHLEGGQLALKIKRSD
jgi:hypothetical protein